LTFYIATTDIFFSPFTIRTVPPFVDDVVKSMSEAIGFDVETLSYVLGLLLCYPLGMILNALPFGKTRHIFSFILGAFLLQFTIGVQVGLAEED